MPLGHRDSTAPWTRRFASTILACRAGVGTWTSGVLPRSLGLERYEAAFRENEIDDTVLPNLTAEDLKDFGRVRIVGQRRHYPGHLRGCVSDLRFEDELGRRAHTLLAR